MLAGRRVVLGVTGGIAAYKAVEVCRRLVDDGAFVSPVLTDGRAAVRRRDHLLGAGVGAGAHRTVGRSGSDSAHPAGPGRRRDRRRAGHSEAALGLRVGSQRRPVDRDPDRDRGARGGVPGDAHRNVGAPGGPGERCDAAPARGPHRRSRTGPARGRRSGHRAARCTRGDRRGRPCGTRRSRPGRPAGGRDGGRHARRSTRSGTSAIAVRVGRATRSPRPRPSAAAT